MAELAWAVLDTPVGKLSVGCTRAGVAQVRFGSPPAPVAPPPAPTAPTHAPAAQPLEPAAPPPAPTAPAPAAPAPPALPTAGPDLRGDAVTQLTEYFAGRRRRFDVQLDWSATSRLQRQVLAVLFESVGYGETVSYGTLARRVHSADDGAFLPARAIGQIMGSNPIPLIVPCHRVVAADGLGGYSGGTGLEVKRWLLTFEGALPPTLDWEPTRLPA